MSELQPLHAINVYIEPWFREEIITKIFEDFSLYPEPLRKELVESVKNEVKVSGFRNPLTAPKRLLVREVEKIFETDPRFVSIILRTWMKLFDSHENEFRKTLKDLDFQFSELAPLYPDAENAFETLWPDGVDYQKVIDKVREDNKTLEMSDDEIVFYSILLTGCLPGESE
ncbi:MAG TPA: hypothetical protein GX730_09430 [Chloroflexi bacterium]|jgi:hypothetical protein|nr:hypothetical protein [Chloroflexota bacterium]